MDRTRNKPLFSIICSALLVIAALSDGAFACSQAIGYFYQVTQLRGTVVGMDRGWPRWLRQHTSRNNVTLRLYEYRCPLDSQNAPLLKSVKTDKGGRFDFGTLNDGHYTLIIDWPSQGSNSFDVEITKQPKAPKTVTIDASPVYPDCTGGHEFLISSN